MGNRTNQDPCIRRKGIQNYLESRGRLGAGAADGWPLPRFTARNKRKHEARLITKSIGSSANYSGTEPRPRLLPIPSLLSSLLVPGFRRFPLTSFLCPADSTPTKPRNGARRVSERVERVQKRFLTRRCWAGGKALSSIYLSLSPLLQKNNRTIRRGKRTHCTEHSGAGHSVHAPRDLACTNHSFPTLHAHLRHDSKSMPCLRWRGRMSLRYVGKVTSVFDAGAKELWHRALEW